MELNYTPQTANGINIDKAVDINEAFHISRQFWAHQVTRGVLNKPKSFINSVPHMSFVGRRSSTSCARATRRCSKANCSAVFAILKTISRSKSGRRW
jgi:malate dehydrogenase (quinone)